MNKALLAILIFFAGSSLCTTQPEKYPLQRGDARHISALSWSPRNDLILTASGDENALRLWEVGTGRALWKTDVGFLQDDLELYSIRHVAWTSDLEDQECPSQRGSPLFNPILGRVVII